MDSPTPPPSVPPEKSVPTDLASRQLVSRLKFWSLAAAAMTALLAIATLTIILQVLQTWKLRRELNALKTQVVRLDQPVEIFNPFWGTVLDAVDPQRVPSRDARDPRYGALIQQYIPLGNDAQNWRLRTPSTRTRREPLPEEAYLKHASSFVARKEYDRAVQSFQHFVALYPDSPAAHNGLGMALRDKGQFAEAVESHNRAVELAPQRADLLWERAITRQRSGDLDASIKDCQLAFEKNPNFADAHNTLAITYRTQREYTKALTHHDRALELNPQREDFWRERALTHQANGDPPKAAADTDRARELRTRPQ